MKSPEKIKRELVQQWLDKAEEDFQVAQHLAAEQTSYLNTITFHSQQAVEKFIKAFLTWHQVEFPKTHDLDELLDLVATVDKHLSESLRKAAILTAYGVDARYPSDFPRVTPKEAREAADLAAYVRDTVRRSLSQ
jgi:HEPN domain-containing protein